MEQVQVVTRGGGVADELGRAMAVQGEVVVVVVVKVMVRRRRRRDGQ